MSPISMILTGLMIAAMLLFIAPNVLAMNRGYILRNIALWLAIFVGLSLVYKTFGPEGTLPLFGTPASHQDMSKEEALKLPVGDAEDKENAKTENDAGAAGFAPPKE